MKKLLYALLFLPLLFQGCKSNSTKPDLPSGISPKMHAFVIDSIKVLDSLANIFLVKNPGLAKWYSNNAIEVALKYQDGEAVGIAYNLKGLALLEENKDSSFYYYSEALIIADSLNLTRLKARLLYNIAYLYVNTYDFNKAVILLDSAIFLAKIISEFSIVSNSYNLLGTIKFDIQDYTGAESMYMEALNYAKKYQLNKQIGTALSSLSVFESNVDQLILKRNEAIEYLMIEPGTEYEIATILCNIGTIHPNQDTAIHYCKKAVKLAQSNNFAIIEIGAYNSLAYRYMAKGRFDKAEECLIIGAIPIAVSDSNHDWLATLYDSYADVLTGKGDYSNAVIWLKRSLEERVISDQKIAGEHVRLLTFMLDLKNKEITIQTQESDLLTQRSQLYQTRLWFAVVAGIFLILLLFALWFEQRRKIRIQREKIISAKHIIDMEESEKSRTARELHDITGQLIMGLNGLIDGSQIPNRKMKEEIKENIADLGNHIRNISHKMKGSMVGIFTFNEMVEELCDDFGNLSSLKINLSLMDEKIDIYGEHKLHAYRIVQELLTNAMKYVGEGSVTLVLKVERSSLRISYNDTGPGFEMKPENRKGMGLRNIEERVKLIEGKVILDSIPGKGTTWEIFIPIAKK